MKKRASWWRKGFDAPAASSLPVAAVIIALATAEVLLGVAATLTGIPIVLAVSHNWLAALLLALLKLLALSTPSANTAGHAANRLETGQDT